MPNPYKTAKESGLIIYHPTNPNFSLEGVAATQKIAERSKRQEASAYRTIRKMKQRF
ncbi:hypothetical protein HN747_02800 [archaeon]|jgi:hypothetical protein|nr:hypothetical protein [archaeon]